MVDVVVRPALLHSREHVMMIWRKSGCNKALTEHSFIQSNTTTKKEHTQRDLQHGALQELEAPPVVRLVGTSFC